jgi:hypothetical protein
VGRIKLTRPPTQIVGIAATKAWVLYGVITADAALLHAESDDNEEGPFSRLKSLLLAYCTSDPHLRIELKSSSFI